MAKLRKLHFFNFTIINCETNMQFLSIKMVQNQECPRELCPHDPHWGCLQYLPPQTPGYLLYCLQQHMVAFGSIPKLPFFVFPYHNTEESIQSKMQFTGILQLICEQHLNKVFPILVLSWSCIWQYLSGPVKQIEIFKGIIHREQIWVYHDWRALKFFIHIFSRRWHYKETFIWQNYCWKTKSIL